MRTAKTERDVIALGRDNWQFGDYSILCDGRTVFLSEQAVGHAPTQNIEIPKAIFDKIVDAYAVPQK